MNIFKDGQVKEPLFILQGQKHDPSPALGRGRMDDDDPTGCFYHAAVGFPF